MHVIGYLIAAIIPTLCCYFIMRWKQRQEIDAAYNMGFDECQRSTVTAVRDQDEFWDEADEQAYGEYFRDARVREPVAVSVVGYDTSPPNHRPTAAWSQPAPAPTWSPPKWNDSRPEPDAEAQAEVDQFCRDMDAETELYLAHMGADMIRTATQAARGFVRATDVTGPIPAAIIARETQITHREVVIQPGHD